MQAFPHPFPETKPATEFIDGHLVQKMSPRGLHARVQAAFSFALTAWAEAGGRGRVGVEWDFDLTPPGERKNRLTPDVAYVSYVRIPYEDDEAAEIPIVAPNVAVEILSPGQSPANSQERIRIFLACGAELVILVDPRAEYAMLYDGGEPQRVERAGLIEHPALPEFSMPLLRAFTKPQPR
jgi:Uma2 family endonuclease